VTTGPATLTQIDGLAALRQISDPGAAATRTDAKPVPKEKRPRFLPAPQEALLPAPQAEKPLPYTGPATTGQLTALKYLQHVASEQETAVDVNLVARRWLLLVVLALQAALSARLVWSNTAFQDEGLYLWAGHLEWAHWLHGTPLPAFADYFSGAPVLYPPLGALANHFGGLAGARFLSLGFMLIASVLLHGTTRRLFDRGAANFATLLFAVLGSTQFLGALATYDAMALMLIAFSAWLVVIAGNRVGLLRMLLLLFAGSVAALSDATKYAATLWTPVVVVLAVLVVWRRSGRRAGVLAGVLFFLGVTVPIAVALRLAGSSYWIGITSTTLTRQHGNSPAIAVLYTSLGWVAVVMVMAVMGAIIVSGRGSGWHLKAVAWLFVGAVLLAPLEQARIGVFTSLFKHVAYGGWFGCVIAGFALAAFIRSVPPAKAARGIAASAAIASIAVVSGVLLAGSKYQGWPTSSALVRYLKPISGHGTILAEELPVLEYYLPNVRSEDWKGLNAGDSVNDFTTAINTGSYSIVVFAFVETADLDLQLRQIMAQSGHYQLARTFAIPNARSLGQYTRYEVWRRVPAGAG
jgi:4-amino-4-deoxy-L-arabinose transferase-like glycosyltransferase